jgi:ATP-binding cassette subfamily B protein
MAIFVRLLGFLRDYKRGVWWSAVLAALAMVATIAIPVLTGLAIGAIEDGDREQLKFLAGAIVVAGVRIHIFFRALILLE